MNVREVKIHDCKEEDREVSWDASAPISACLLVHVNLLLTHFLGHIIEELVREEDPVSQGGQGNHEHKEE